MEGPSNSYAKELVRRSTGRDIEPLLRDLYVDRRHSQQAIADAIGVSRTAVSHWLREYGISRNHRAPVSLERVA